MIEKELLEFNKEFKSFLYPYIDEYLQKFVFTQSKRLRPLLGILFCKTLGINISDEHKNLFFAIELIHNASLIHDDVIDNSQERRGEKSLNKIFDNSLSVVSGDLLLSISMKAILDISNKSVRDLFVHNIMQTCYGEIRQYFSRYENLTIEEYIEKSRQKTAFLFEISVLGGIMIAGESKYYDLGKEFCKNFGIAFQLKNDLDNYMKTKEDYNQGIYTAPVIYGDNGIEKTKDLINNYLREAKNIIEFLPKNKYSETLNVLVNRMRENNG